MALARCGQILYPNPNRLLAYAALSTSTNYQINGSGQKQSWVFSVPASGTITKVGVRISTCASAVTCRIGLYTVDTSGNPTTTLYGGSNYGTFTPSANTYSDVTLGTAATATQGDIVALVVEFDSTAGDMYITAANGSYYVNTFGYTDKYNGSTWSKQNSGQLPACHVYYSDGGGTYHDIGAVPFSAAVASAGFNSGTAGADEYALKVAVPFKCRVAGVWHNFAYGTDADYEIVLYSGTTALKTLAVDASLSSSTTGHAARMFFFASGQEINAGDTVRVAIKPTTVNNVTYRNYTMFAAGSEQSLGVPQGTCQSTRVDAGAWSDATTTIPVIGLIIDQLDDGASAGGGGGGPLVGASALISV